MPIRFARGGVTAVAALGLLIVGVQPASTSKTPGWRIARTVPPADALDGVAAISSADAWVWGLASTGPTTGSQLAWRWNGKAWRKFAVPKQLTNQPLSQFQAGGMAASSAANVWLFPDFVNSRTGAVTQDAFRWNGRKWASYKLTGAQNVTGLAFSPTNVWAVGQAITHKLVLLGPPYGARFNGRTWKRVTLPGDPRDVSAPSADDIWMLGPTTKSAGGTHPVDILMHWDGRRWHTLTVPTVKAESGGRATISHIVALGPKDLLAVAGFPGSLNGSFGPPGVVIAHWNGKAWRAVAEDRSDYAQSAPVSDGSGGLWLDVLDMTSGRSYLLHYSRGHVVRVNIPGGNHGQVFALASIPATTSAWAIATVSDPTATGVILKYGK